MMDAAFVLEPDGHDGPDGHEDLKDPPTSAQFLAADRSSVNVWDTPDAVPRRLPLVGRGSRHLDSLLCTLGSKRSSRTRCAAGAGGVPAGQCLSSGTVITAQWPAVLRQRIDFQPESS